MADDIIVRRYGIKRTPDWAEDCDHELRRGNMLRNNLVEVARTADSAYTALMSQYPAVAAAESDIAELLAEQAKLREERKRQRGAARSRRVDPEVMRKLREVAGLLAQAKDRRAAARVMAKVDGYQDKIGEINQDREAAEKRAVDDSGVFYDTAAAIYKGYQTARSQVFAKRRAQQPAELHFRRFDGGGRIINQIKGGGVPLSKFLGGAKPASLDGNKLTITAFSNMSGERREISRVRTMKKRDGTSIEVTENVRWRGRGERRPLTVELNVHRDIPDIPDLRVKSVAVVLRDDPDWHPLRPLKKKRLLRECRAIVTATAPEGSTIIDLAPQGVVAINLGWRRIDGNIRVGTVVAEGDIMLPLLDDCPPGFVMIPQNRVLLTEQVENLVAERHKARDVMIPRLKALPWSRAPAPIAVFGAALAKAPTFGCRALARLVVEWIMHGPRWCPDDLAAFNEWRRADNKLRGHEFGARRRFFGERRERYRIAAKRIAEYASVILLDEMDISQMARLPKEADPELEIAARHTRQIAAPSELRAEVIRAAARYGRLVIEQPGPSSWICPVGNHRIDPPFPQDLNYYCAQHRVMLDIDVANCQVRLARHLASPEPLAAE